MERERTRIQHLSESISQTVQRNQKKAGPQQSQHQTDVVTLGSKHLVHLHENMDELVQSLGRVQSLVRDLAPALTEIRNSHEDLQEIVRYLFEGAQTQFQYTPDPNRHNLLLDQHVLQLK